jgi:hypothetical protein
MNIDVFKAEREAGLEDLIRANASVALLADINLAEPFAIKESAKVHMLAKAENRGQIDLHYLKTVMVSSGWNRNDDVFDAAEMWEARHTPEDKPFNLEHNQNDIIGHITGCVAADENLEPISDSASSTSLPDPFHIITTAVLYKIWEDPDRQARMDRLIAEIAHGRWFVSMEALFHGFDYSIKTAKGHRLVSRNEKTAFLTKHLRAYGGDGIYEDAQIGRVLRKIVFSGKGLVKKPANPDSVILESANASGYELPREERLIMSDDIKAIDTSAAEDRTARLEAELAAASAELNAMKTAQRHTNLAAAAAAALGDGSGAVAQAMVHLNDDQFAVALAAVNDYLAAKLAAYKEAEQRAQTAQTLKAAVEEMKSVLQQIKEVVKMEDKEEKEEETEAAGKSVKKMALPKKAPPPEAANVTGGILNNVIPSEEPALADSAAHQNVNKVAAQIAAFFGADETEEPAAE